MTCRALSVNHLSSSSRLVRPGGVRWGWALSKELLRSSVAQGLVGADGVVGPLPLLPLLIELGDLERAGGDLLKLLRVGAVSALDVAIEFGGARRNNEHRQALPSFLTYLNRRPCQVPGTGYLPRYNSQGDTLPQASPIIVDEKSKRRSMRRSASGTPHDRVRPGRQRARSRQAPSRLSDCRRRRFRVTCLERRHRIEKGSISLNSDRLRAGTAQTRLATLREAGGI